MPFLFSAPYHLDMASKRKPTWIRCIEAVSAGGLKMYDGGLQLCVIKLDLDTTL